MALVKLYLLFPGLKSPGLKPGVTTLTEPMALQKIRLDLFCLLEVCKSLETINS